MEADRWESVHTFGDDPVQTVRIQWRWRSEGRGAYRPVVVSAEFSLFVPAEAQEDLLSWLAENRR